MPRVLSPAHPALTSKPAPALLPLCSLDFPPGLVEPTPAPGGGVRLRYGSTQWGGVCYSDLGDGRSAVVGRHPAGGWVVCKHYATLAEAQREAHWGQVLAAAGLDTQVTLEIITTPAPAALIWRPTVLRVGSLEYLARHHGPAAAQSAWVGMLAQASRWLPNPPPPLDPVGGLRWVVRGWRTLVEAWNDIGWIHGCLNTDNVAALPCSIDLGASARWASDPPPTPAFDPHGVFGSAPAQLEAVGLAMQQLWWALDLPNYSLDDLWADYENKKK